MSPTSSAGSPIASYHALLAGSSGERLAAETHETAFRVLQALVLLHVAAILFYAIYKRRDLVRPMITGRAAIASAEPLRFASAGRALLVALVAAALSWWVWNGLRL